MVIVAHKYHGIVINGVIICIHPRKKCRDSVAHRGVNHLVVSGNGIAVTISVYHSSPDVGYIVSGLHSRIIHFVGVGVGQVDAFGPVGFDGDGRHPFGYIPVGALVEDAIAAAGAIEVLVGAVAVGEVVSTPGVGSGEGAGRTPGDADDLPTRHHAVAVVVFGTHLVVVGQLHLVVVVVSSPSLPPWLRGFPTWALAASRFTTEGYLPCCIRMG